MRTSGILMPVFSLPSRYGIGTFGKEARNFVDYLAKAGQTFWQILPVNPTGFGDSPYQSFSTFAGNPYFIDLEELCDEQLLKREECEALPWGDRPDAVDYGTLYQSRYPLLRKAYARFLEDLPGEFEDFCQENAWWLDNYALYMAIKNANGGKAWTDWPDAQRLHEEQAMEAARAELAEDIGFYSFLQYLFYQQWWDLKEYANDRGILMIGDVPIYVSMDSADVWANPQEFMMDEDLKPIDVAGCPPDAFSEDGQLWGNPLYRWDEMKKGGYQWWMARIKAMAHLYDVARIDHFRGFESFYAIPYGEKTARKGRWIKGPGLDLFETIEKELGSLPIIVEDLGILTKEVRHMLKDSGYPGMKVLQFGFQSPDGDYMPHNYSKHCVCYTGTHDNDTTIGWLEHAGKAERDLAVHYMHLTKEEGYNWGVMRTAWESTANIAIVPMTDVIGLGSEARINAPSTSGTNWKWRALPNQFRDKDAIRIYHNMEMYARIPKWDEEEEDVVTEEKADAEAAAAIIVPRK